MEYLSRKGRARVAAKDWKEQYFRNGAWLSAGSQQTYRKLLKLKKNDPDKVAEIIGNDSWVNCWCDECSESVEKIVTLGQEPNYTSATASVCQSCLEKAIKLCKNRQGKPIDRVGVDFSLGRDIVGENTVYQSIINCEYTDCSNSFRQEADYLMSIRQCLELAANEGWKIVDHKVWCPNHES